MPASDATLSIDASAPVQPLLHKDSMTPAQIDPDLARDALLAHPLVAAQTLLGLAAAKISPAAAGFSSGFIRSLALSLAASKPDLDQHGDRVERALKNLTAELLRFPDANDAWLEGVIASGKSGSPEKTSHLAVSDPRFNREPPGAKTLSLWIEAGLIRFSSVERARWLSNDVPGLFSNPLGDRVFRSFLPGGLGRAMQANFFSRPESDESIVSDMIDCGVFFRLAAEYDQADPHRLASALETRLSRDTRESVAGRPPAPAADPLYAQLLAWSAQRVASNTDWIRGKILFRGQDFNQECRSLMLSRAQILLEAEAIDLSLAPALKRAPKRPF